MPTPTSIQIGEYLFNPTTGELKNRHTAEETMRLPPQPAQLLQLLVNNYPEIISREAIQRSLWPGVTSDFDKNLHFCVRQIRSAFGESAAAPTYVETIPRRGYRLIAEVETRIVPTATSVSESLKTSPSTETKLDSKSAQILTSSPHTPHRKKPAALKYGTYALLGLLGLAFALWQINQRNQSDAATQSRIRIAIMPFETVESGFGSLGNGEIAFDMLEILSPDMETLDIIGPSTTEQIVKAKTSLREFAESTQLDFIVNGKFISTEERKRLLVEVIRARDGSHVWVKAFPPSTSNLEIAELTSAALHTQISSFTEPDASTEN
ncbi:winged helix-turn-helix domain-containing protein [bacterium]|nr:winged helix-turn-helix domain-containing protein [bacterium]